MNNYEVKYPSRANNMSCQHQGHSRKLFRVAVAAAVILNFLSMTNRSSGAMERESMARDNLTLMLEAINDTYSARDRDLDCDDYIKKYLGPSNSIKYYIDQFNAHGIKPIRKYLSSKNFTAFEILYAQLKNIRNSTFKIDNVIIVVFTTEDESNDSAIRSCRMVLKAAPNYL